MTVLIAAFRGPARALRRSTALLLTWEAALLLTVVVSNWFGEAAYARFRAEVSGEAPPELPYPGWLPGLLAPLGVAVFFLYPAVLAGAWLALPARVLPRMVKVCGGIVYAVVVVTVLAGLFLRMLDGMALLGVYAAVFPLAFVILPQLIALECWKRSTRGACVLWQAVTFGALALVYDGGALVVGAYLVLRFGALTWTVWLGGVPVSTPAPTNRGREAHALG